MNNLILFTNRSGSTVLCDMISYACGTVNLGEGLHSCIRDYNYNNKQNKSTQLYKELTETNLTGKYHNPRTRGSDHINFWEARLARSEIIKKSLTPWTAKENIEKLTIDIKFVEYCCKNPGINVYMTHRANIVEQFISLINARYRESIKIRQEGDRSLGFVYTNTDEYREHNEARINFQFLHLYANVFLEQLMMWKIIYDKFKPYINVVSYEQQIKPMDFTAIGISKDVVESYNNETKHLIPTPNNARKIVVVDDHPKPMIGAWEQALHYVGRFQYLVDI